MRKTLLLITALCYTVVVCYSQNVKSTYNLYLKTPGNLAKVYQLNPDGQNRLVSAENIPIEITEKRIVKNNATQIEVTLKANEKVYFSFEQMLEIPEFKHDDSQFLMPGFWYHKNLRSPKEAPSFATSDSWQVREDRLSTPLTGIFNTKTGNYYTVIRLDSFNSECLAALSEGEVILSGKTSLGFTGFKNSNGNSALVFGFPYHEAPKTYIRKLILAPEVQAFEKLEKGEVKTLIWEVKNGNAADYSAFMQNVWNYCFDTYKPLPVKTKYSNDQAKAILSNFYAESYVGDQELKYFSGVTMRTDDCISSGVVEVGFVGRVLLNAFNALEYGEQNNRPDLVEKANSVFDSYLKKGFTETGIFKELLNYDLNNETEVFTIRRQSEGLFAVLNYLKYERKMGRKHTEWEKRIKTLLANFQKLQKSDGSFPRKFDGNLQTIDVTGGSTPSATVPLTMAYHLFKDKGYLETAKRTAVYLQKEIISKADYFSSTLDANCEDKEASLYASTAMYYLATVTSGAERKNYIDQAMKAAYFCLSWYYTWDVPFAPGQMLGDVNFKSRGWGNVSVENNHIDVFIFEFATVLDELAKERNEPRLAAFSSVIKTSMLQLMPVKNNMFSVGKVGYYPEVVQHTNWDYNQNGKGFLNSMFAPGWTVASLWQMLSPNRVTEFFR